MAPARFWRKRSAATPQPAAWALAPWRNNAQPAWSRFRPEDIAELLPVHGDAPSIVLAPARDGRGTNAVACSPADAMPLRFGGDSFIAHRRRARAQGIEPRIVRRPGLALDLDTPDDLAAFLAAPSPTRAYAYLADRGVAGRLQARAAGES
jgi:2-phospho-L-lactate guanylyltransferase